MDETTIVPHPRVSRVELMTSPIYLDHHATTPCDPRVVERMLPYFTEVFGNPSSVTHEQGRKAGLAVEDARITVAKFFGVRAEEIYFTAGATEANNIALNLLADGEHLITSAIEHKSITVPAERLRSRGVETTLLEPDGEGFIRSEAVGAAIRANTRMVSIEAANGEVGTLQPVDEIAALCRERGVLFHSDVTQAAGKVPVDLSRFDLASMSAHKLYGPKGVGALYARRGIRLAPLITGGGQERGVRAGTVSVASVVGLAAALEFRREEMAEEAERLTGLRDLLRDALLERVPGVRINGPRELRLPGNLNASFAPIDSVSLMTSMKRFSLSAGSACSSGDRSPSRILQALGVSDEDASCAIRFGLGKSTTREQIDLLIDDLTRLVPKLREVAK